MVPVFLEQLHHHDDCIDVLVDISRPKLEVAGVWGLFLSRRLAVHKFHKPAMSTVRATAHLHIAQAKRLPAIAVGVHLSSIASDGANGAQCA
jgi:hypothetical protein